MKFYIPTLLVLSINMASVLGEDLVLNFTQPPTTTLVPQEQQMSATLSPLPPTSTPTSVSSGIHTSTSSTTTTVSETSVLGNVATAFDAPFYDWVIVALVSMAVLAIIQ